ncbi:MAG: OprO/OprP family phosphate-selective porin [Acidobacteriota bacterium]|nr:OprO/OprP family phosphate-selective porin [Acidobacteriota bacterium]
MRRSILVIGTSAILAMTAVAAEAQAPAATQPPSAPFTAGWQDGFVIQSPNGDNRLVLGLTAQADGRFSLDDPLPITNTFTIRKARPTFSGRVAKYFDFKVMPDFGNGTAVLQDVYFDIRFSPKFRVRSGKDKTPIGYELLQGDAYLLFPERALASSLVPNRDVGFQVQGDLSPKLSYAGGVFNGVPDGSSSTADVDANNSKDLAGRIVWQPFLSAKTSPRALNGLGFQIGGSTGKQAGTLPAFRTSVGQTYFSYATGAAASGARQRITPAAFYYYKSFGGFIEYMRSTQKVSRANSTYDVANDGWEVTGSYVLTGEAASDRGVRPSRPFDPSAGKWGALQVVARYSQLNVDPLAFTSGLAAATASRKASAFTIAANWYPAAFIKYYATFERTSFGGGASRPTENVVLFRTQLAF